ncbi:MAG: glycosyltransferase family 4 protein [Pseudomonadota bacterium]
MKVLFAANRSYALWSSRRFLIRLLLRAGYEVEIATTIDEYSDRLVDMGVRRHELVVDRGGGSLLSNARLFWRLFSIYRRTCPDVLQHFHAKPVILGTLASRWAGVKVTVNTITGLGSSLPEGGVSGWLAKLLYRLACRLSSVTVFQNKDDRRLFEQRNILSGCRSIVILSSGVDTSRFLPDDRSEPSSFRVLFMARLLWDKGVQEFAEAAQILTEQLGDVVSFELAGEIDHGNHRALSEADLERMGADYPVDCVHYIERPEAWMRGAAVFVCPSYYREGVPRVVLEAASCGLPVVGCDVAGTREAIQDGATGFIVPPRDPKALAAAIMRLYENPDLRHTMGQSARRLMLDKFDVMAISERYKALYMKLYEELPEADRHTEIESRK